MTSVPHDLQPSCCKCKKPYPLNNMREWKNWVEVRVLKIEYGHGGIIKYYCAECFKKVKL